jgi:meso-butanediol dehydrogenase/(S,S)-butanediol dehydrogenase/diacetyl reductase
MSESSAAAGWGDVFSDRALVVTGAASGIGRAAAETLLAAGGSVVAVDLDGEKLGWTAEHERAIPVAGDVTLEATNAEMVDTAVREFGSLQGLVLNAGLPVSGPIVELDLADFDRVLEVNLRGVVLGVRAAIPTLQSGGGGAVVVTASVSGLGGDPNMWAYNAAKGGVVNLVRSVSLELAQYGIRVNAVCPGPIETGMTRKIPRESEAYEALRSHIPLQRWGTAREVGNLICFLASDLSSFVTGAIVPCDGGITASSGQFLPPQVPPHSLPKSPSRG